MKSIVTRLLAAATLGVSIIGTATIPSMAEEVKITVLGVGDIYDFNGDKVRGGFARLNAVAKSELAANSNTLYVFNGDMFSPSLLSGLDMGANTVELTNIVPFDLAVPGNHEFDFGPDVFEQRISEAKYPWAAINITGPDNTPIEGLGAETVMKQFGSVKVALVPIALDETATLASIRDWRFSSSVTTGLDAAQQAREAGADIVIAVTHTSHDADNALRNSHEFDLIVSGHDHDLGMGYDGVSAYVETSTEANYLPIVDLNITVTPAEGDKPRAIAWSPQFRILDTATVDPDPETQAMIDKLAAKLAEELDVEIGTTADTLSSLRAVVRGEESGWGNLIADAMKGANGADIAITNGGGIRGDKIYAAGTTLTRKDVFTELPFGNKTVVVELSGAEVLTVLENGFSQMENGAGRFPQVSGLIVEVDATKASGSRVISVQVNGKPLDPAQQYKVATNDYMLSGGDGFTAFADGKVLIGAEAAHLIATDVIDYVAAAQAITAKVEGRIVIKN